MKNWVRYHAKRKKNPEDAASSLLNGLAGWWNLDEGTGTDAADSTANGNNGTLQGTAGWTTSGKVNDALLLSNDGEYVLAPTTSSLEITGDITLSAWAYRITDTGGFEGIISKWANTGNQKAYFLGVDNTDVFAFYLTTNGSSNVNVDADISPSLDTWYHIVGIFEAGVMKMYIDGNLQTNTNSSISSIFDSSEGVKIGSFFGGSESEFRGRIDEVGIWNRALTSDEVATLYNGGDGIGYPG